MNILRCDKNSAVLVVTPLLPGHRISKDTKRTIKRNKIPFTWISYEGNNNIPTNVQYGLETFRSRYKLPKYILPLDRDIVLGRYMIDRMTTALEILPREVAFAYVSFKFQGAVNKEFPAQVYDINKLVFNNYISSNSLIRIDVLDEIGGFVTDEKYKRLLDWSLWLKMYYHGYIGMPVPIASFTAMSTEDDVSAGTQDDFELKRRRVMKDFVGPIVERAKKEIQAEETPEPLPDVLEFD